jgi:hypothetical protein
MASPLIGIIVGAALGVPLLGLCWSLVHTGLGWDAGFVIRRRTDGRVVIRGKIPRGKRLELQEFCSRDLARLGSFTVRGSRKSGRGLELRFNGRLTGFDRQRIRNFLVECLG